MNVQHRRETSRMPPSVASNCADSTPTHLFLRQLVRMSFEMAHANHKLEPDNTKPNQTEVEPVGVSVCFDAYRAIFVCTFQQGAFDAQPQHADDRHISTTEIDSTKV